MKIQIHPKYYEVTISCACGMKHLTKSTKQYNVDICSSCHPYFTGKSKLVDAEGRIDRFRKKYKIPISE
ncbi:MAG: 50S ribosomal protein L31 [Deltaproteobacteria bacterium]|nr:MAG: 50S ribosomal protein L31 [Deltaproteobacteria bacterium]